MFTRGREKENWLVFFLLPSFYKFESNSEDRYLARSSPPLHTGLVNYPTPSRTGEKIVSFQFPKLLTRAGIYVLRSQVIMMEKSQRIIWNFALQNHKAYTQCTSLLPVLAHACSPAFSSLLVDTCCSPTQPTVKVESKLHGISYTQMHLTASMNSKP